MDTERLIARFRSDVHDQGQPPLWSDAEVFGYLDEAQKWLCRKTFCLADSSSAVAQIQMGANAPWGIVDPRVLKIRYAQRTSDNQEIHILNFEDVQMHPTVLSQSYSPFPITLNFDDTMTGPVTALVEGMEEGKVRWMFVPAVDDTAKLIVYRLPLDDIDDPDNVIDLEVPEKHHLHLLDGMKAQAYKKEDAETFNKSKQVEHETAFVAYCAQVNLERERLEHKHRTIRYGGISGDYGGSGQGGSGTWGFR